MLRRLGMRRYSFSRAMRVVAVTISVTMGLQIVPASAWASPKPVRPTEPGLKGGVQSRLTPEEWQQVDKRRVENSGIGTSRPLTHKEMRLLTGRSPYRNKYFGGARPWDRSLRDVSLSSGNLFKSFTDIQVSPGAGAGLALQRTYNSADDTIGPFGVGWTHAYDIRIMEDGNNIVPRTDFFGGNHPYHRDADGLYSPPPYLFDQLSSDYNAELVNGPPSVQDDTDIGMDGTIKHYLANGSERDCDYIQDRFGNTTSLTYGETVTMADGTQRNLLTEVTDPSDRNLIFSWTNLGTAQQPVYRISQVQGPQYTVEYGYGLDQNLSSVTLDTGDPGAGHLNRTTSFTYTSVTGANGTESGLLASISEPLGETISYTYTLQYGGWQPTPTGTVWVNTVSEPAAAGAFHTWTIAPGFYQPNLTVLCTSNDGLYYYSAYDSMMRFFASGVGNSAQTWYVQYDSYNNVNMKQELTNGLSGEYPWPPTASIGQCTSRATYGSISNVLTTSVDGFPAESTTTTYYNGSQYFQKASVTDANGHTTRFGVGSNVDPNPGNRGNVLWVQDGGYSDPAGPSYQKQFVYAYNANGQKASEINLNGVETDYSYSDAWGNLTGVVQDHKMGGLNRTTTMVYDVAGHVLSSTSPVGLTSTFTYNSLGQPTSASFPANGAVSSEVVSYAYDLNGRTSSVTDNRGTTTMGYEGGDDRLISVTDPVTGTTSYTYRLSGARTSMTLPGGGAWTYSYTSPYCAVPYMETKDDPNSVSQTLISITDDQGRRAEYHFDITGHLHESMTNQTFNQGGQQVGAVQSVYAYSYNSLNNGQTDWTLNTLQQTWRTTNWPWNNSSPGSNLSSNAYTYDNAGQRLTNTITIGTNASRTEQYGYDDVNRLVAVNYGDGQTQSYTFDAMGNRLSKTDAGGGINGTENYIYNNANMLLSRAGNAYTNDVNGNTLTGGGRTNTWDSENRMTQCAYNGTTSQFTYAADGLRHRSVVNGVTTDFALDASMFVREMRNGASTATYLVGARGPEYRRDDVAGTVSWYLFDGLGSVLAEVSPTGTITSSRNYDVYGNVRSGVNANGTSAHKFVGNLGHPSDNNSGLIYMQARYMDPATGRFVSEDKGNSGDARFLYCDDDPTNKRDKDGKDATELREGLALIAIGLALSPVFFAFLLALFSNLTYLAGGPAFWVVGIVGCFINWPKTVAQSMVDNTYLTRYGPFAAASNVVGFYTGYAGIIECFIAMVDDV